ncbi:MAG: CPBP family intramembrane metalloprotease [Chloroflexota bacterium]|nr:MAG: CPBP family intramembrane metalloprotease [Chloroflexota bacterium]
MFDWALWAVLILVCIPGILVSLPRLTATIEKMVARQGEPDRPLPSRLVLFPLQAVQLLIFIGILDAVGVALAPEVGLSAPFFSALVSDAPAWPALQEQLLPAFTLGLAGAIIFVAAYYLIFRPRLDPESLAASEGLRQQLGPAGRLLYGGIVEEVIARWGLMTLVVWLLSLVAGEATSAVMWSGIIISGVLFGLVHLPSYAAAGARLTRSYVSFTILLNLWASVIFGLLFWQVGLAAAMLSHMLFHLVWLPFDRPRPYDQPEGNYGQSK